jgi:dephospho-CoA kinase
MRPYPHSTGGLPRPDHPAQFIFGYGSLAADLAGGHAAELRGHRRTWGVAMDNSVDVPGYKHYRLRSDGSRPAVCVAFLDLVADADAVTTGVCVPVDASQLPALDRRERNYDRVDVTAAVVAARGTVWAYVGAPAGRERLARARAGRRAVVSRDYLERTRAAFAALGGAALAEFERTAAVGDLPVWELERFDH